MLVKGATDGYVYLTGKQYSNNSEKGEWQRLEAEAISSGILTWYSFWNQYADSLMR